MRGPNRKTKNPRRFVPAGVFRFPLANVRPAGQNGLVPQADVPGMPMRTIRCDTADCKSYVEFGKESTDGEFDVQKELRKRGWACVPAVADANERHLCPFHALPVVAKPKDAHW